MITSSSTLFRYISRNFMYYVVLAAVLLLGVTYIVNTVELMRRTASMHNVSLGVILQMAALSLPHIGQRVMPFAVLFGAIYTCWKLNKTHELIVIRASGISAWQFLFPMIASALAFGLFATAVINPLSSFFIQKYEQMERTHLNSKSSMVAVLRTGIWLRQPVDDGYALLHASAFDPKEWQMSDVIVLFFDKNDGFLRRIDSPEAYLREGHWEIRDALVNDKAGTTRRPVEKVSTELNARKIEESFASPDTISFWKIPEYIQIMEDTGFPATRLTMQFQSLLAQPLFFMAMVILAATFSLRPPRIGGTGVLIALGVAIGFFVFFMESMLNAFGISQKIPAYLAAWTPAVVSLLLGTTALLHLEDG